MSDYLLKALAFDGQLRVHAIQSTDMVNEAQRRHNTWPTASAALGRAMTVGTIMGAQLKGDTKLTITIEGGGPIGAIIVDSNAKGETRGYVSQPHVHFDLNQHGKLDVRRAVGTDGFLNVIKDLGMRENFTGRVPIVSGEIGEDFTYYFAKSEQIPSAVAVGVLVNPDNTVKAAGGFVIQVLPGADDENITLLEERLKQMPPVSRLIDAGDAPEDLLERLLGKGNFKVLEKMPVSFTCSCSKEKLSQAMTGLGKEELQAMIEEDHGAEASCHFCREFYHFSEQDLKDIINRLDANQ